MQNRQSLENGTTAFCQISRLCLHLLGRFSCVLFFKATNMSYGCSWTMGNFRCQDSGKWTLGTWEVWMIAEIGLYGMLWGWSTQTTSPRVHITYRFLTYFWQIAQIYDTTHRWAGISKDKLVPDDSSHVWILCRNARIQPTITQQYIPQYI